MDTSAVVKTVLLAVSCTCLPAWGQMVEMVVERPLEIYVDFGRLPSLGRCRPPAVDTDRPPAAAAAALGAAPLSPRTRYEPMVELVAQTYGLDSALLHAVIFAESRYDARALSKQGARGLMQLMPGTARRYDVVDAFDPLQNLHGGARYLRDLVNLFHSDLRLVLAAYHAGEHAVIKNGNRIPPLQQTLDYVSRVLGLYRHYQRSDHHGRGDDVR